MTTKRVALVTGANRGIGEEIAHRLAAHGFHVLRGIRAPTRGASNQVELDVTDAADVAALRELELDVLINNAGVSLDGFGADVAEETLAVNFFGALAVTDAVLPKMREGGRVVMVSSGMGERSILRGALREQFMQPLDRPTLIALMNKFVADVRDGSHQREGWPSNAYSVSKIGMTALAGVLARELEAAGDARKIKVNSACPGWVRTRMGGRGAPRSVEEGAETPVWLARLPENGPTGGFFRDRRPAEW